MILGYLERRHPEPSLLPEDPFEFARALFLEEYADTRMAQVIGPEHPTPEYDLSATSRPAGPP